MSVVLCIIMVIFTLSSCNNSNPTEKPGNNDTETVDLKKVSLSFYLMGDPSNDVDQVTGEINKLLLEDLNCDFKVTYSTWTDWSNKYNLMLASGEPMDLLFAANWTQYNAFVRKNAFQPLDELLPKNAPNIWALLPESRWDGVKVDGKIYGVPSNNKQFVQHGATYREDLRVKYDLPEITNIETLGLYIETVKENEPDMNVPILEPNVMCELFEPSIKYQYVDSQESKGPTNGLLLADPNKPSELVSVFDLPEYKVMLKTMKSWADKGFWSKSVLSSQEDATQNFEAGKIPVIIGQQLAKSTGVAEYCEKNQPDWEVGFFHYNDMSGIVHQALPTQDLMVVPKDAPNPERALMVLDKFMTDRTYYDLTSYGIKDLNYHLNEEGMLDNSAIDSTHSFDLAGWAWSNSDLRYKSVTEWSKFQPIVDRLSKAESPNKFAGFTIDLTPVQTEHAAINQVYNQYLIPLQSGLVDDVDAAFDTMVERMNSAGFIKFKDEIQKQLNDYLTSNGIK